MQGPKLSAAAERTVALLAFEDVKASPVGDLMDLSQRQKTASELNAAILDSQSQVLPLCCSLAALDQGSMLAIVPSSSAADVHARLLCIPG